jgi:hypothetical protein
MSQTERYQVFGDADYNPLRSCGLGLTTRRR